MLFSSFRYILLFLPIVAIVHALVGKTLGRRAAQIWLLLSSLIFYILPKPASLLVLLGSILFNWSITHFMGRTESPLARKRLLQFGLVANIALLCSFKYLNFFAQTIESLGVPHLPLPDWAFPLGVSFFTLQQVIYLVDCYEALVPPNTLFDHLTFVSFFPYVISGPITKAKRMIGQLHDEAASRTESRWDLAATGLYLFTLGLFKKVFFADTFGRIADLGYAGYQDFSTVEAWAFSLAYTFQMYFDFSGYTDMARGSALILGFDIPINFNSPYRSLSMIEFWQRWHITLSNFITTYLYTPILRSFKKATLPAASFSTLAAMLIAGLWHGPAWTYVVWGGLHGAALVVNQFWRKKVKRKVPKALSWAMTFSFVNLTLIFFRAPSLSVGAHVARLLVPVHTTLLSFSVLHTVSTVGLTTVVPAVVTGIVAAFFGRNSNELAQSFRPSYVGAFSTAMLMLVAWLFMNSTITRQFVYFVF
jgi:D-alanyl-lipoteichoic acid acyltransferase DltB (MBOAT superfamily)